MRKTPKTIKVITPVVEHSGAPTKIDEAPPSAQVKGNVAHNPAAEQGAESPSVVAGCSTAVTPINSFIPVILDALPYVFLAAQIFAMLDPDGRMKKRHENFVSKVRETIDMDDFLPTTYDDYRDWKSVARST